MTTVTEPARTYVADGRVFLRIKHLSLMMESRINRREELRLRRLVAGRVLDPDGDALLKAFAVLSLDDTPEHRRAAREATRLFVSKVHEAKAKLAAERPEFVAHTTRLAQEIADHRREVLRPEARATHLAYGFLRGRTYRQMEANARSTPDLRRVWKLVARYSEPRDLETVLTEFEVWCLDGGLIDRKFYEPASWSEMGRRARGEH